MKNKEKIQEKGKKYYDENKELILEKNRKYQEKNKEKIKEQAAIYRANHKEPIQCDCGGSYILLGKSKHYKTKKHIAYLEITQNI